MHDKLKLLLEQVNMPLELYSDFKDGNLDIININANVVLKTTGKWQIIRIISL